MYENGCFVERFDAMKIWSDVLTSLVPLTFAHAKTVFYECEEEAQFFCSTVPLCSVLEMTITNTPGVVKTCRT